MIQRRCWRRKTVRTFYNPWAPPRYFPKVNRHSSLFHSVFPFQCFNSPFWILPKISCPKSDNLHFNFPGDEPKTEEEIRFLEKQARDDKAAKTLAFDETSHASAVQNFCETFPNRLKNKRKEMEAGKQALRSKLSPLNFLTLWSFCHHLFTEG